MEIHDEITIPGEEARYGDAPTWLRASPVRAQTRGGQLYLHQAMVLELLGQGQNLVISTGTASGKSLVLRAPALHHLVTYPNATAIAIYPIKALARDQVIRWRNMAEAAGLDSDVINRIDGDVRDLTELREILQRTRLALMTPDVIQQWLMAYSDPLYGKRPLRHDLREVQNTQYNVRRFISNLSLLILDEAHTYDGALGTHCLYLLHRLQQRRRERMSQFEPLRVIAASATIHNAAQHPETLTSLPFQVVDDRYNGSPRAELIVQHVVGREPHDEGWRDLQAAVREVISEGPERSYIAFIDDRQLAERAAAGIKAARSITEDPVILESRDAMAYRSGLMRRGRRKEALRAGDIRGLASTSAMEMGFDVPDLQAGFNLGLLHSLGKLKQRARRVGRTGPGRFIIMAPHLPVPRGQLRDILESASGAGPALSIQPQYQEHPQPLPGPGDPAERHGAVHPVTHRRLAGAIAPNSLSDRPGDHYAGVPDRRSPAASPPRHRGRRRRARPHRAVDGAEAYAALKMVSEFPMDVAQRILNAGYGGDALILGRGPLHAWRYREGEWCPARPVPSDGSSDLGKVPMPDGDSPS